MLSSNSIWFNKRSISKKKCQNYAKLQNAKANAEAKKLNPEELVIKNVFVNQATEGRRRTYMPMVQLMLIAHLIVMFKYYVRN